MTLVVQIIGVLCMLTIMFVAIWGFIIAKQSYSQIRYKNYLLEKLNHNISMLARKNNPINLDCKEDFNEDVSTEDYVENEISESEADFLKTNEI